MSQYATTSVDSSTYIEWMWQSNSNPFSTSEPAEWRSYSEEENNIIEEAYMNQEPRAMLKKYHIHFERGVQIANDNPTKQRPVKRCERNKASWIKRRQEVGRGGFGIVYRGTYRGYQEVAIKDIPGPISPEAIAETRLLRRLYHPNIVRYIDVIHTSKKTTLVMEFIGIDNLSDYINTTHPSLSFWRACRAMMSDVAYGMIYLHEKRIIHADLKSGNILLRNNGHAVLCDFGLSRTMDDSKTQLTWSAVGTERWLAPELCFDRPERSSFASDVWAFGCVLLEIITRKSPWKDAFEHSRVLLNALSKSENAEIFEHICRAQQAPEKLRTILCHCCAWLKADRPDFSKIINDLSSISDADLKTINEEEEEEEDTNASTLSYSSSDHEDDYMNVDSRKNKFAPRSKSARTSASQSTFANDASNDTLKYRPR